jgi:putative hydrolase
MISLNTSSLHVPCLKPSTIAANTAALVKAMDNPHVKIIDHPDDSRFLIDYEQVVQKAAVQRKKGKFTNSQLQLNLTFQ